MSEKKRQCGTCRFFLDPERKGHGKCGHPLRAGVDSDLIMYRANELGCRSKWGTNFWHDIDDMSDPASPETPQQPSLPEPVSIHAQYDDEVTSVSIAGRSGIRQRVDDDVVDAGTTSRSSFSYHDGLQDERRELLSRSSHDALAAARKRHSDKMARQRELIPFADDGEANEPFQEPEAPQEPTHVLEASESDESFPPDDFVEEEHPAHQDAPEDGIIDDGVNRGIGRSPRMRKLIDKRPKDREAMTFSPALGIQVESNNPENRGQWNSVPRVDPGMDLPFKLAREPKPAPTQRIHPSAAPASGSSPVNPTRNVSVARDVVNEARRRSDLQRREVVQPINDEPAYTEPTPRLMQRDEPIRFNRAQSSRWDRQPERTPEPSRVAEARISPLRGHVHQDTTATDTKQPAPAAPISNEPTRNDPSIERPSLRVQEQEQPRLVRRINEPSYDVEPDLAYDAKYPLLEMDVEIARDVPRACGTCASFQPDATGDCGACVNRFANPEKRIVEADGLACLSTIGTWWVPADEEVWLDEFRIPTSETPRMDMLLAELAERRRAERTRMPVLPDIEEFA